MLLRNGAMELPGSHYFNQDDDVWLTLRGTRHKHLCGVCLRPGDTFPGGFYTEAMCEHCIAAHGITPLQHCPFGLQLQEALGASYGLLPTSPDRTIDAPEPLMAPFRSISPTNGTVCAACGCGDNTIGHWSAVRRELTAMSFRVVHG